MSDVLATPTDQSPPPTPAGPTPDGLDPPKAPPNRSRAETDRLLPLDGWRGLSILAVLACHLLPLGRKSWELNGAAGLLGMSLFFTLSGFLITSMLLKHLSLRAFFIRRGCRILPLVLLYTAIVLIGYPAVTWVAHDLFLINYWHAQITDLTGHLWSICVEIHFYLAIGLLVLFLRRTAFWILPAVALAITGIRIYTGTYESIETHLRVDEILAGGLLALLYARFFEWTILRKLLSGSWIQPVLAGLLLLSCHPASGPLNYARPYFAASLVGSTLLNPNWLHRALAARSLAYIATISYALYIWHPLMAHGWLSSGGTVIKYAKRPLVIGLSFLAAHLSTFYYEKYWIALGKKWSSTRRPRQIAPATLLPCAAEAPPAP